MNLTKSLHLLGSLDHSEAAGTWLPVEVVAGDGLAVVATGMVEAGASAVLRTGSSDTRSMVVCL